MFWRYRKYIMLFGSFPTLHFCHPLARNYFINDQITRKEDFFLLIEFYLNV